MFGWDKEAIKEKYNALTKDELEEDGYYYKEIISVCDGLILDTLKILKEDTQDIIKILKLPRNEKEILLKELSNSLNENTIDNLLNENILEYLTCYNNLHSDIKNIFYYIEKNLKYQNLNELKLKKEIITYDDLYHFSYIFFAMINSKYKEKIDYLFENRLINISNKKIAKRYDLDNATIILEKESNPYINIVNTNTKDMYNTLIHEISHALKFLYNKKAYDNSLLYLDEVHSIYSSFLVSTCNIENNEFFKIFYNDYNIYKNNIIIDYIIKNISNSLNHSKKKIFINSINDFVEINSNELLKDNFFNHFKYGFSLIIALYLLDIYKKDPEKSFYFFDKILTYKGNNYKEYFNLVEYPYKDYYYGTDILLKYDDYFSNEIKKRKRIK